MVEKNSKSLFSVKSVVGLSGLNEHTIRAWETRCGAISPERTVTGRRLYSAEDVGRLRLLAQLVKLGHSISAIAKTSTKDLQALLVKSEPRVREVDDISQGLVDDPRPLVARIKQALRRFDLDEVQSILKEARFRFGGRIFVLGVVAMLMADVGELVAMEELSIAHEHALSAIVKSHLLELMFSGTKSASGRRVALAAREGDLHEIGLLISGVLCAHYGYEVVYIGPNMPPDALATALKALRTEALILGLVELPPGMETWTVADYVSRVAKDLPLGHEIWLGGMPRRQFGAGISGRPLKHFKSLAELDFFLKDRA